MKKKKVLFIVLAVISVILAVGAVMLFTPVRIVGNGDNIIGLELKYHDSRVQVNKNEIIEILSKYDAVTTLTKYFPYKNDQIDFEISFSKNNKPLHILLGEFNIWYESSDWFAHDILEAGMLKTELKNALKIE